MTPDDLLAPHHCVCRESQTPGIVHRADGPCYVAEVAPFDADPSFAACTAAADWWEGLTDAQRVDLHTQQGRTRNVGSGDAP